MIKLKILPLFTLAILCFLPQLKAADLSCNNLENNPMWAEIKMELTIEMPTCHPKNVALTFDDGPSAAVTPTILAELKRRNIKATFFITTTNLDRKQNSRSEEHKALVAREMKEGHLVGDHGYEHDSYDLRIINGLPDAGYSDQAKGQQINLSLKLLNEATNNTFNKQQFKLFRFPYGRGAMPSPAELDAMEKLGKVHFIHKTYSDNYEKNVDRLKQYRKQSAALASISTAGFDHLGWNHDSEDFRYSVNVSDDASVKKHVKENLKRMCSSFEKTQVALFHDIKPINGKAIPLIVDIGRCFGINFISPQEMMAGKVQLEARGILIPKNFQMDSIADYLKNDSMTKDPIGELIGGLCPTCEANGVPQVKPPKKSCVSENGKVYKHCEGSDSICYDGEWSSRQTAIENQMCSLVNASVQENKPTPKTCKSENGKVYGQCQGENSICYNGVWSTRSSIIAKQLCDFTE